MTRESPAGFTTLHPWASVVTDIIVRPSSVSNMRDDGAAPFGAAAPSALRRPRRFRCLRLTPDEFFLANVKRIFSPSTLGTTHLRRGAIRTGGSSTGLGDGLAGQYGKFAPYRT